MPVGPKIVSLLPSATEIVCALGFSENLVGRSHECDFPDGISALPICTDPKFDVDGSSREIDDDVRSTSAEGAGLYSVDREVLSELVPDIVITQDQCEVCAVNVRDVEEAVHECVGPEALIVTLEADSLAGIYEDIRSVAEALDVVVEGETLVDQLTARYEAVSARAHEDSEYPGILCLEWLDPLMAAGNWVPELVDAAGGESLLIGRFEPSRWIEWDEVMHAAPAVLLLIPCGFDIDRTMSELGVLQAQPGWEDLPAVRNERVYVADGNAYFNRPGPRIVESLEVLTEVLHPDRFDPVHEGSGWKRL
jgi:iron complex transport system substrate-binding protein